MLKRVYLLWAALLLALTPMAVEAARVSPMIVEVQPLGRGSIARIVLTNDGQAEYPVEVQMFSGEISEKGELALTPADEDFLLFPAQIVVPAQSQQVFRVQYIGDPDIATSKIYYMQIRQIPVDLNPGESQLQVVVNFNVLINVIPDDVRAEPVFETVRPVSKDGVDGIEVRLVNQGNRYFTAGTSPWKIGATAVDGSPVEIDLPPQDVARLIGVGVVAPGRARVFFIPTEKPLEEGTIKVSMGD